MYSVRSRFAERTTRNSLASREKEGTIAKFCRLLSLCNHNKLIKCSHAWSSRYLRWRAKKNPFEDNFAAHPTNTPGRLHRFRARSRSGRKGCSNTSLSKRSVVAEQSCDIYKINSVTLGSYNSKKLILFSILLSEKGRQVQCVLAHSGLSLSPHPAQYILSLVFDYGREEHV